MVAYRALPAPPAVVLVAAEIFGVHEYIRDVCRRLAKAGYRAVAPRTLRPPGRPPALRRRFPTSCQYRQQTPTPRSWPTSTPASPGRRAGGDTAWLAITGFCWGGRITWLYAAHNLQLKAGVAWYGCLAGAARDLTPQHPVDVAARLRAPRPWPLRRRRRRHPQETIDTMRAALKAAGKTAEIHVHPNAPRLPRRLPAELSQGRGGRRLAADAGLVAREWGVIPIRFQTDRLSTSPCRAPALSSARLRVSIERELV